MKVGEIVSFRKDLLFNGAVQIGWFERDKIQADKAARHFIFHGPEYHGVAAADFGDVDHKLVDTATFTADLLERISGNTADEPFALAIAGYGTGKSHLGVTLASLLSDPTSGASEAILNNISIADKLIGNRARDILSEVKKPYLVLAINGMQDFDLTAEIVRQIFLVINNHNLDTAVLENLRPRFKTAINFTESFFEPLNSDFERVFGKGIESNVIVTRLKHQDDEAFCKVNEIFEHKMSQPIQATGHESLHDFIRVTKETYCGEGKPFAGIVIIFDEFGRYLEFSVHKPHIAGSGSLQKLFESVQENSDKVFLLSFIQYELKAYISRVAPELRDDLNRYVTRFDSVRKTRLSTNMETLISTLLEKKDQKELDRQTLELSKIKESVQAKMQRWFPDIKNYSLWLDPERFERVILKGCWPLHPISTWIFYKLSSAGKSLQQRSALSLLADIITTHTDREICAGKTIVPADLCNESLVNEFLSSEHIGQQGATAHAFESVVKKYQHELREEEKSVLKSILLSTKIGVKIDSRDELVKVLAMFSGLDEENIAGALKLLEHEYAVLAWNERLSQYEIVDDALPRSTFLRDLASKVAKIDTKTRADIFSQKYGSWTQNLVYNTDFGIQNKIHTREWHYKIAYTNVQSLNGQIDYSISCWMDARAVDEEKGQLIYCYVGPDSDLETVKELSRKAIKDSFQKNKLNYGDGASLAVVFLHDNDGGFGEKIGQYWVLQEQLDEEDTQKFSTFISNTKDSTKQEIDNLFSELERSRHIIFATEEDIKPSRISVMLTSLFDRIYPKRITFPFDGFHTARGNAAKDSQTFIKELFLGNLDRDWISARAAQQRNRAYFVLDEAWGAIAEDGSIRLKPMQPTIKEIFEELENDLHRTAELDIPMKLGAILKKLCAPPYGCNLASAGMMLALFVGRRKNEVNILKSGQAISFENWLQEAMPSNFLDLSILEDSAIIKVSADALSEWEALLEDWESEKIYIKKINYIKKANELGKRIPIPQGFCTYRYHQLEKITDSAQAKLDLYLEEIYNGIKKIESGKEKRDVSLITWGASILLDLLQELYSEDECWTDPQFKQVEKNVEYARLQIKDLFPDWLDKQTITNIERLSKFKHINIEKVAPILDKLGLKGEKELLKIQVIKVEENIRHIEVIKKTASDVHKLVQNSIIDTASIATINSWLEQVDVLTGRLKEAQSRTDLVRGEVDLSANKLKLFHEKCKEQIASYQKRLSKVYDTASISSLSEISNLRKESTLLLSIYEGQERDCEDLLLVIKQLDLIETHYKALSDLSLASEYFESAIDRCYQEIEEVFMDDAPPLDCESIYKIIVEFIRKNREAKAGEWLEQNVPDLQDISIYDSHKAISTKNRLQNMPPVLSSDQILFVQSVIQECDNRIDKLEVDGILIRFESLSPRNKEIFLRKIASYIKQPNF